MVTLTTVSTSIVIIYGIFTGLSVFFLYKLGEYSAAFMSGVLEELFPMTMNISRHWDLSSIIWRLGSALGEKIKGEK